LKILLIGKNSQIGSEFLKSKQFINLDQTLAVGSKDCDITDIRSVKKLFRDYQPDIIINCAAYTAVDKAEIEMKIAKAVNEIGPKILAQEAQRLGSLIIHFSTDYIFDGNKKDSYVEGDRPNPLSIYGKTKLAGEKMVQSNCLKHIILRTSWVYNLTGNNFINKILNLATQKKVLKVVANQYGTPTSSILIVDTTISLLKKYFKNNKNFPFGLYHLTASGDTNWHEYACYILDYFKTIKKKNNIIVEKIIPVTADEYFSLARRPKNSRLNIEKISKTFDLNIPDWRFGVNSILDKI
jgi:dTDP-4-dehydrorhamnose reductase